LPGWRDNLSALLDLIVLAMETSADGCDIQTQTAIVDAH